MKVCYKCSQELPFENFYTIKKNKDGYQSYCKICSCSNRVKDYKKNIEKEKIVRKKYQQKIKDKFIEYKKTLSCFKCKESRWYVLDFHHNENNKKYDVANMWQGRNSWETIMKEIDKCITLCANCHREEHYNRKNNLLEL